MGTSGVQSNLQQGQSIFLPQNAVFRQDGLGIRLRFIKYRYCFCLGVPPQKSFTGGMIRLWHAHRYAAVGLFHLPFLDDFVHLLQCHGVFGAQHQSAGVAVYAVAQCRCKAVFLCRVVLAFLVQILLHPPNQGIGRTGFIFMYHQPGGLIRYQNVFVLINDGNFVSGTQECLIRTRFFKKLIVEVQIYYIAHRQPCADLGTFAIYFDPLGTYSFVHHGRGKPRHRFDQEFIQPLSGVIWPYRKFFHFRFPFIKVCRSL